MSSFCWKLIDITIQAHIVAGCLVTDTLLLLTNYRNILWQTESELETVAAELNLPLPNPVFALCSLSGGPSRSTRPRTMSAGNLAAEKGWILVQDTAWEGYEETPRHIVEGYLTMAEEICDQTGGKAPTHIFLQAGVGAMAGGIAGYFLNRFRDAPPYIAIVEPSTVACITLSAEIADGKMHSIEGNPVTIMAGLNWQRDMACPARRRFLLLRV